MKNFSLVYNLRGSQVISNLQDKWKWTIWSDLKWFYILERLPSTIFSWSILEFIDPNPISRQNFGGPQQSICTMQNLELTQKAWPNFFNGVNLTFPIPSPDEKKKLKYFEVNFYFKSIGFYLKCIGPERLKRKPFKV